jgi:Dolichyl-phosphate-mannose-protein mannosyltransferase
MEFSGDKKKFESSRERQLRRLSRYDKILLVIFLFSLPLSNPWVRGDGVGYYAFGRSLLIEHNLNFEKDWLAANTAFRISRTDASGSILAEQFTSTGHLDNHFSIGPAILWSPFLIAAHVTVRLYDALGGHVAADGYSRPYLLAMAFGTVVYGFLSLWISFRLARKYLAERWAFLGTLGIWFASSLLVYMYFNPSWSHAHSAFMVALFVWYWDRTRQSRTTLQWVVLGAIAGLMMDVYYPNAILLLLPLLESTAMYWKSIVSTEPKKTIGPLLLNNILFAGVTFAAILPTFVSKKIIYGSYLNFGYGEQWFWDSPALLKVCFSSEHGLFSWTPIVFLAVIGLFLFRRYDRVLALYSICIFAVYLYVIGCYQDWHGLSSFGNRFFVSLTVLFVLGLGAFFDWIAHSWKEQRARVLAPIATGILILWNLGLVFQWGVHLIPARGPISWRDAAYNQVAVVPVRLTHALANYLTQRRELMRQIEEEDVKHLKSPATEDSQ